MPNNNDSRFAKIHSDPKFKRPKKKQAQIQIDERFAAMINDPAEFDQSDKRVDKYGRSKHIATRKSVDLKRYYRLDEETDKKKDAKKEISDVEEEDDQDAEDARMERMGRIARGEIALEDSDDYSSPSENDEESLIPRGKKAKKTQDDLENEDLSDGVIQLESDAEENVEIEEFDILDQNDVPKGEPSHRFAVVNMDWDNICAHDLYKVFDNFKPQTGRIISVRIFPSEFGKERMAHEDKHGPPVEIFKRETLAADEDDEDGDVLENESGSSQSENESEIDDNISVSSKDEELFEDDDGEELNVFALRKYQLERLRYFYAVVECDSISTAKAIFEQCDGTEYEHSSSFFDLRYIPEEMSFDEDKPRDESCGVDQHYKPRDFVTQVLQYSKPKLTWDDDDPVRVKVTRHKFTKDDLKTMDFDAYLASEEESEDENPEEIRKKYLKLLSTAKTESLAENGSENEENGQDEKEDQIGEMEITFAPGLSNLATDLLKKKRQREEQNDETVFEKYLREKKEKKKEKKKSKKTTAEEPLESDLDDIPSDVANDPFFAIEDENPTKKKKIEKKPGKKGKKATVDEKEDAEMELLMLDEESQSNKKHFDFDNYTHRPDVRRKKVKGTEDRDEFQLDTKDPRFDALFTSSNYAIDPTSSKFRKTSAMEKILQERQKRVNGSGDVDLQSAETSTSGPKTKNAELDFLVKKIKNNTKSGEIKKRN